MSDSYHDRPEWSYSSMKTILDSGIDYAVALKNGNIPQTFGSAVDLGQLAHMIVLGGEDTFAISEYPNFRTKAAQQWRDKQKAKGKNIITKAQFDAVDQIVKNIEQHPHSQEYLYGTGIKFEQEMFAKTPEGVELRGKADVIKLDSKKTIVSDLKTTAQFDKFKKNASWSHYDLQAATYTLLAASIQGIDPSDVEYMFCVAETVAPYRVQWFRSSTEFIEAGERKLRRCIDAIAEFGDNKPNFLIENIEELGDWSI